MGKKRKVTNKGPTGPRAYDPADSRLGPVNSYEDVANSEDEYFLNRDKIMFDEEPQSKRRRKAEEEAAFFEPSDEEILSMGGSDDSESDDEANSERKPRKPAKSGAGAADSDDGGDREDEEQDAGWWGSSKKEYYNADEIATETDALEEEAEAKRIQAKRLAKMAEEDFIFDEEQWRDSKDPDADDPNVVTEVLEEVEITDDMSPEERSQLLHSRYPEIDYLAAEFQELQPQLVTLQKHANGKSGKSVEAVRYWVLGCYVAALASYFAILTSPARDGAGVQKSLDPAELREHEIMETLVTCRNTWQKVKNMKAPARDSSSAEVAVLGEIDEEEVADEKYSIQTKKEVARQRKKKKLEKARQKQAKAVEDSLADLDDLLKVKKKKSKKTDAALASALAAGGGENHSDFGEEEALDARAAADKAARKKSLRFYTSQIVQKSTRRADAGRDAGGDMDIPYRERLRDRQARLNAEAERRGKKDSKFGADLDGEDSNDEDAATAAALRNDDDEYYDMVAGSSRKRKEDKAARYEAFAAAGKADRVVEQEVVGEDGKRKISYVIQKNKGLAPRRKKENRNPRVKKRMQFEEKQKKLRSQKQTWKGGEPKAGYGGELSGIAIGIVRARKL